MVVQSLGHEVQGQCVLVAGGFLDLGTLVLEPDLDLRLVQAELLRERLAPLLRDVAIRLELALESLQLLGREGRARPLVLLAAASSDTAAAADAAAALLLLQFARPRAWRADSKGEREERGK